MKKTSLLHTALGCSAATFLVSSATSHGRPLDPSVTLQASIASTDGKFNLYEATSNFNGDVHYYVDVVGDTAGASLAGVAASFQSTPGSVFGGLNPALGSQVSVLGLVAGLYPKTSWSSFSAIPFETAFGAVDNAFIWIAGANPITGVNDTDSTASLTTLNSQAWRVDAAPASQFVAFGPGGSVVAGSLVPEPSAALLLVAGACGISLRRKRKMA